MEHNNIIECGGFYFIHNFDSGNLGHVERVPTELIGKSMFRYFNLTLLSPKTCNNFGCSCQFNALFTDFLLLLSARNRFEDISMRLKVPWCTKSFNIDLTQKRCTDSTAKKVNLIKWNFPVT